MCVCIFTIHATFNLDLYLFIYISPGISENSIKGMDFNIWKVLSYKIVSFLLKLKIL